MIPKKIHYCWFGHNPLPKSAKMCISSWRKYLPDYEVNEWNEENFDVHSIPYISEAYDAKKYAFVSDYARFKILYEYGGIYFDTDVEIIEPFDEIIQQGPFMGIEKSLATSNGSGYIGVNAGLGLGAEAGMPIYKEVLDFYERLKFKFDGTTVVTIVTQLLLLHGFHSLNEMQQIEGITIYPAEYFCPMDSTTGIIEITPETVSIHHYSCSWIDHNTLNYRLHLLKNILIKLFGAKTILRLTKYIKY